MNHYWRFIVLLGLVSLFSDVTYEGARGVTGPFLGSLGASAAAIGAVAGAGELFGYGLRILSGYLADRTKRYWALTIMGYVVNLGAVPLLALAGSWEAAAVLILLERTGKAIRTPARDAMLSNAADHLGPGRAFGVHEAMDQIGAVAGPLFVAAALAAGSGYRHAFAWLAAPACAAVLVLLLARWRFPQPDQLAVKRLTVETSGWPLRMWIYLAGAGLLALGFSDFPLIAFHLKKHALLGDAWIPLLYAAAMGVDALSALAFGHWFDRSGIPVLATASIAAAAAAPMHFLGTMPVAIAGVALWGAALGAVESVLRAVVGTLVPPQRRGAAYGLFHSIFGVCWFAGSAVGGWLYDRDPRFLAGFAATALIASAAVFALIPARTGSLNSSQP